MAKEHAQLAINPGLERDEVRDMREAVWEQAVSEELRKLGKTDAHLVTKPFAQAWKVELADSVQRGAGASVAWLAGRLKLGRDTSLRSRLSRVRNEKKQQNSA